MGKHLVPTCKVNESTLLRLQTWLGSRNHKLWKSCNQSSLLKGASRTWRGWAQHILQAHRHWKLWIHVTTSVHQVINSWTLAHTQHMLLWRIGRCRTIKGLISRECTGTALSVAKLALASMKAHLHCQLITSRPQMCKKWLIILRSSTRGSPSPSCSPLLDKPVLRAWEWSKVWQMHTLEMHLWQLASKLLQAIAISLSQWCQGLCWRTTAMRASDESPSHQLHSLRMLAWPNCRQKTTNLTMKRPSTAQ